MTQVAGASIQVGAECEPLFLNITTMSNSTAQLHQGFPANATLTDVIRQVVTHVKRARVKKQSGVSLISLALKFSLS